MSQREFNHLLSSLNALSPEQLATLRRELDSKIAAPRPIKAKQGNTSVEETAFDVMDRNSLIGCIKGSPKSRRPD